jgi:hypothetical protein
MLESSLNRVGSAMTHLRDVWSELDYAQRRSLELRTGLRFVNRTRPTVARTVSELEALYASSGRC